MIINVSGLGVEKVVNVILWIGVGEEKVVFVMKIVIGFVGVGLVLLVVMKLEYVKVLCVLL